MRLGRRILFLLAVLLVAGGAIYLVAGRSSKFQSFGFETPQGARIPIVQSGRVPRAQEAFFRPGPGRSSSAEYRLTSPFEVASSGEGFALSYTSDIPSCTLSVFAGPARVLISAALPPTSGNPVRFLLPLAAGSRIWGYRLYAAAGEARGTLTLMGAGVLAFIHGFSIDPGLLTVDGSMEVLSASASEVSARITQAARAEMAGGTWLLRLTLADGAVGGRVEVTSAEGSRAVFEVNPASTPGWLDFARGSIPFVPRDVVFSGALRGMQILQVPARAPLPADPGQILSWDRSQWRNTEYELFSWSRFPRVLIMDTASYAVQDSYFKRLAFFVEKAGHAGRLESLAALDRLHGYNAHDYRPQDLARFFAATQADPQGLSPAEAALKNILEDNGVLRRTANGDEPGEGCILSISRSSSPLLRSLLLTHEAFHGLYFTIPAFPQATERVWQGLSADEQALWVDYLAARGYDSTDHWLVANEFQSYLMQQGRMQIQGFQDSTLQRMEAGGGPSASRARRVASLHPRSFVQAFELLDSALQAAGGPPGGEAIGIRRVDREAQD